MKHLKAIFSVLALIAAFSCTKSQTEGNGRVTFAVSSNDVVADNMTKSNVSDYTALPATGDFTITILDESSSQIWAGKISEWDAATPLLAGNYTVNASYGDIEEEGFDKPYFTGSQTFAVKGGETSSVSVPVSLGNTIIRISCSDYFKKYYSDYTFRLTRGTAEIATFVKDETKAAFVDGYKIKVEGTLQGELKTYSFEKEYTGLDEATAYTINFDAPNVGGSTITISFNDTVEVVELGDYELND
jgi:hypothetical protein